MCDSTAPELSKHHPHLLHAEEYRSEMANRFSTWNEVTGRTTAA